MGHNTRQHYVPQSYLKAWSQGGKRIWTYDIVRDVSAELPIRDVAQERYFYDDFRRKAGAVADDLPANALEQQFQRIEDAFLTTREVALGVVANKRGGTLEERYRMAWCVAVQLLRTPWARDVMLWQAARPRTGSAEDLIGWLDPRLQQRIHDEPGFASKHISLLQLVLLWRSNIISKLADELAQYIWIIARNDTAVPFYTSDAPIAAITHLAGMGPYFPKPTPLGSNAVPKDMLKRLFIRDCTREALELVFPVTPKVALFMFHPRDFDATLGTYQGKVLVVGTESAQIRNIVIAGSARRQVFAARNHFSLARAAKEHKTGRRGTDDTQ